MKRPIERFKRLSAKRLRSNETHAEQTLWRRLRELDLDETHFRRQVPIGRYIVDFVCLAHRLIVEVDGSQHGDASAAKHDGERTRWFEQEGYRVLRFWNNEVMVQTEAVMEVIHTALTPTPPRLPSAGDPPPQGEG
jgi:very-short-patch-repair endonuclease